MIGNQGMVKLSKANVLLVNVGGLGIEVAKNVVLAGVHSFTVIDKQICEYRDLGCQFYVTEEHIASKANRYFVFYRLFQKRVSNKRKENFLFLK